LLSLVSTTCEFCFIATWHTHPERYPRWRRKASFSFFHERTSPSSVWFFRVQMVFVRSWSPPYYGSPDTNGSFRSWNIVCFGWMLFLLSLVLPSLQNWGNSEQMCWNGPEERWGGVVRFFLLLRKPWCIRLCAAVFP
jgi:hypothetical protein